MDREAISPGTNRVDNTDESEKRKWVEVTSRLGIL
jgi:hypothetical protein